MRSIKKFLTMIDIFGINFTFRYREKEMYQTALGGFFFLLFVIALLVMGIYYFIPFINRKNYTIVYYTMNLALTEEVNLFASESNIAFGLSCESNKKETRKIEELLYIYKCSYFDFPKFAVGTEVTSLIFYFFIQLVRIYFGSMGNRAEASMFVILSIAFSVGAVYTYVHFFCLQTYVLRIELITNGVGMALWLFELIFGLLAFIGISGKESGI